MRPTDRFDFCGKANQVGQGMKFTKWMAFSGVAGMVFLAALQPASATDWKDWSVYGGVTAAGAGLFTNDTVKGAEINIEARAPSIAGLGWLGNPRPTFGADIATRSDQINQIYGGLTFDVFQYKALTLQAQLGGSLHDARLPYDAGADRRLGCRVLFHLGVAADWRVSEHWSAQLFADHMSNANLCSVNDGYETAGVRIGYHF